MCTDSPATHRVPLGADAAVPLKPEGAGRLLGVSAKHVIRLIQEGLLPAANVGRGTRKPRYRVARADVEALLRGGRLPSRPPPEPPERQRAGVGQRAKPAALAGLVDYFA